MLRTPEIEIHLAEVMIMHRTRVILQTFWKYLREVSGENDYERYFEHIAKQGGEPMSRQEFYLDRLNHKHTRPTRCC